MVGTTSKDERTEAIATAATLEQGKPLEESRAEASYVASLVEFYAGEAMRIYGRVLTRPMLAEHVWGLDFDPESNIVDVYVGYLRRKIDGPGELKLLHTVRGAGYVLRTEEP